MKYVKVKFLSDKDESKIDGYFYKDNKNCELYDFVIVPTKYGVSMAQVIDIPKDSDVSINCIKEVLDIIKGVEYLDTLAKKDKVKEIEKELDKKIKKLDK